MWLGKGLLGIVAIAYLPAASVGAQEDFAPSCEKILKGSEYSLEDGLLITKVDKTFVAVEEHTFKPRASNYRVYYVYQNSACAEASCVDFPIILIKTSKKTNYDAGTYVYLLREGQRAKKEVAKRRYDDFHNDPLIVPREPFNSFHVLYRTPSGEKRLTNLPGPRRQKYLFGDTSDGNNPWLTARNYQFQRNLQHLPQCIPIDIKLQVGTESAYIEIAEIEDGSGDQLPTKVTRWNLKLQQ